MSDKIRFSCPYCDERMSVPAQMAGQNGKCPMCDEVVAVPDEPPVLSSDRPAPRGRRERRGYECPYCGSGRPPVQRSQVSSAGWVLFALLLVFTCIFAPLGLLVRETHRICTDCGNRVS